jgi:hypothetical protein
MYAVPAAVKSGNRVILVVGTTWQEGNVRTQKGRQGGRGPSSQYWNQDEFLCGPGLTRVLDRNRIDLIVADGDGTIHYYEISGGFFLSQEHLGHLQSQAFCGPVCSPTVCVINNKNSLLSEYGRQAQAV